jgi:branched-chain amino acid transport system substrate-binding protein
MRRILAVAGVFALLTTAACGDDDSGGSGGGGGGESGPIDYYTIASVSGVGAAVGELLTQGATLAIDEINAKGGIDGRELKLTQNDDATDPATGVSLSQQLATEAPVVVANTLSSVTNQVAPILNGLEVPLWAPVLSIPEAVTKNRPWVFGALPDQAAAFPAAIEVWKQQDGVTSAALIVDEQNAATAQQGEATRSALEESGVDVGEYVTIATGDVDFGAALARAMKGSPDGLVISALAQQAAAITNAVRKRYPNVKIWLPPVSLQLSTLLDVAGAKNLEGVIGLSPSYVNSTPRTTEFAKAFKEKYGAEPGSNESYAYEAVYVIANGLEEGLPWDTSAESREQWQEYFAKLDYDGPLGKIVMGPEGLIARDVYVLQFDGAGEAQLVESINTGSL